MRRGGRKYHLRKIAAQLYASSPLDFIGVDYYNDFDTTDTQNLQSNVSNQSHPLRAYAN